MKNIIPVKNKKFRRAVAVVLAVVLAVLLPSFIDKQNNSLKADISEIEETKETGFKYEYKAGSFKLFLGEQVDNPYMKVRQRGREFEVTVFSDENEIISSPTPTNTDNVNQVPTATGSSETQERSAPTASPTVSPETSESSSGLLDFISTDIQAQESVDLVKKDGEQYVNYSNDALKVKPLLDRVNMEFEIQNGQNTPSFYINSSNSELVKDGKEVIFKTRTGRSSFTIKNYKMTDQEGNERELQASVSDVGGFSYMVNFDAEDEWLNDPARAYPITVTAELVSLFHDRMLPAFPTKSNFQANEKLEVEIDNALIDDSNIHNSLQDDNLTDLKFGLINSKREQINLSASIKERNGDVITLELSNNGPNFKAGIFDLLIQYKDEAAYIAQTDFSWGVLAINPDMSVYPLGSTAQLDMAVLDKNGEMVCDADLLLKIEAPNGNTTELSTTNGKISVSDTCKSLLSDKPDYTTTYQTSGEGEYQMTLSAITGDGSFTIYDSFKVDQNSPFYVKRVGPTRIYPKSEYKMTLEVTSATDSGTYVIEEIVPEGFEISETSGTVGTPFRQDYTGQGIRWEETILNGQARSLSYTFDAPDVSPAMFLLGPVKITENDSDQEVYNEGRSWQIASDAIGTENISSIDINAATNPTISLTVTNATVVVVQVYTYAGTTVTVSDNHGDTYTSAVSAGGTTDQPRVEQFVNPGPTTGSKTITINGTTLTGSAGAFGLTGTATSSVVDVTAASTGNGSNASVGITPNTTGSWIITAWGHKENAGSTEDASQTSIWEQASSAGGNKRVGEGTRETATGGSADTQQFTSTKTADWAITSMEIIEAATTPTTDQLMRHGNWFSGGSEQYFFWAD